LKLTRGLRLRQTDAEDKIWAYLRAKRLAGLKFRRQVALGDYIVDFVNFENKLVIEIVGGQHNELPVIEKDTQRSRWLEGQGYKVLRFWNSDVFENIDGVLLTILNASNQQETPSL
jgi:very-short-patch-repair endonuclease